MGKGKKCKISECDYIKLKSLSTAKIPQKQTIKWRKIFANDISDKLTLIQCIKRTHTTQVSKHPLKNGQRT